MGATSSGTTTSGQQIVITRVFDAPRGVVFKAWTEPEHMKRWWGPNGFTTPVCRIDLRAGGIFHNCMRSPEGHDYWSKGVYREIIEPERIVCTDCFSDAEGNFVPPTHYGLSPDWPQEALLTVTFTEHEGWSESLDRLAGYLATR